MHPDDLDLIARIHLVAGAAQNFLLEVRPFRESTSFAAIEHLCTCLRDARLPELCSESIVDRVLGALAQETDAGNPALTEVYGSLKSRIPDHIDRFEYCLTQLLHLHLKRPLRVHRALSVIASRLGEPNLSLGDVARAVNVSPKHLSRLLITSVGCGFRQYVRLLRLRRAADMLRQQPCSIKEVWAAVGYDHASAFVRHFKHLYGSTPGQYRRAAAGEPAFVQPPVSTHIAFSDASPLVAARDSDGDAFAMAGARPSRRVLVVDDDTATRTALDRLLRTAGCDTAVAANVSSAVEIAGRFTPHLVVVDYRMPGANGLECIRKLRTTGLVTTRFLLLTGDCSVTSNADALSDAECTVLFKPVDPSQLLAWIESACDSDGDGLAGVRRPPPFS